MILCWQPDEPTGAGREDRWHDRFRPEVYHADGEREVRAILGILALLYDRRAAGAKAALDTGLSRAIADAILDRLGCSVGGSRDASVTCDEAPDRPAHDLVFEAMRRCGIADG
jgi:phosphoglycolate phosphatase-like HAD superfamily hydrolase